MLSNMETSIKVFDEVVARADHEPDDAVALTLMMLAALNKGKPEGIKRLRLMTREEIKKMCKK